MVFFLDGGGQFDFVIGRGRIEYAELSALLPPLPSSGARQECIVILVLDDQDWVARGHGVSTAIFWRSGKPTRSGWFSPRDAQRYRKEIVALGLPQDATIMCRGLIRGGDLVDFKKGPMRMPFQVNLDLAWPLTTKDDWLDAHGHIFGQ